MIACDMVTDSIEVNGGKWCNESGKNMQAVHAHHHTDKSPARSICVEIQSADTTATRAAA